MRRSGLANREVNVSAALELNMRKEEFLANKVNKQNFINMLSNSLEESGCEVQHADGDADIVIVSKALKVAETSETIVVGEDTDWMILLCHHASADHRSITLTLFQQSQYWTTSVICLSCT